MKSEDQTYTMRPNLHKRSILVAVAAFIQRMIWRELGVLRYPAPRKNLEARAARYLAQLKSAETSLTFKIALENLRRECDLFMEEAALAPIGLRLHAKVVELADRYEVADRIAHDMLVKPPAMKLLTAILAQARRD